MVMWRSRLNLTASASNVSPSWNLTPGRSLIVSVLPSAEVSCDERELRHDLQLLVDVEQLVAQRREDDAADEGARQRRVEHVGILGQADAQVVWAGARADSGSSSAARQRRRAKSSSCVALP